MPVDINRITAVLREPIRRVAVHVFPRARFGFNGNQGQTQSQQTTKVSRLLVPVLVERLLRSAENGQKRPKRHSRKAITAAPGAREVLGVDFLEGPFLRVWAFFE